MLCGLIMAYYGDIMWIISVDPSDDITFELMPPPNEDQNNTRAHQPETSHASGSNVAVSSSNEGATRRYPVRNCRPVDRFIY